MPEPGVVLDDRSLNRALLQRQWLLDQRPESIEAALTHLVGMQSQAPDPPFTGLWTRLSTFGTAELDALLEARRVVRIATVRSTLHLVTARDGMALRGLLQPTISHQMRLAYRSRLDGVDVDEVATAAAELLHQGTPATFAQVARALAPRWPAVPAQVLGAVVRAELPLVQVPPRGLWRRTGPSAHLLLTDWVIGARPAMTRAELITRYLAAFGPATVQDIQTWSGLAQLARDVQQLGPELVRYRDGRGRELLDLPGAPLPGPDVPAPVRFLPPWDNLLLSHADRSRVLAPGIAREVFTNNGIVRPTILLDGFVAGTWTAGRGDELVVRPLARWGRRDRAEVVAEGRRLAAFGCPAARPRVQVLSWP